VRSRAFVVVALAALTLTACGGKEHAVKLADARPCLAKLALVVVPKPVPGVTLDPSRPEFASVSFAPGTTGATAANVTFFRSSDAVEENLVQLRQAAASGIRVAGTKPRRIGKTILLSWSSPPSPRQVRDVTACLRGAGA
jgi:hypothetical protein